MHEIETPTHNSNLLIADLLTILEAYHERKLQKLREIRSGFTQMNQETLIKTAQALFECSENRVEYLSLLTQHVMAVLDGGDGPCVPRAMPNPLALRPDTESRPISLQPAGA